MKIAMRTMERVRVLSKSSTDWDMNGRKGTTYKVGVRSGDDIDKVKVSPELFGQLEVDHDYMLIGSLNVSNGNTSFLFEFKELDTDMSGKKN